LSLPAATFALAQEHDRKGCEDHPSISRYPGSFIMDCEQKDYEEFTLPLGKPTGDYKLAKSQHLEGKVTFIRYRDPQGRSTLEVFRNYQNALERAGFETLFTCAKEECGPRRSVKLLGQHVDVWDPAWNNRELTAKLARPEGDVYASLNVEETSWQWTNLYVVEMKPMEAGLVTVDAATLAGDITRSGHVAIYGIYFDTGKADVKPESDATLKEIAKLLQQDPKLKLYVVGHTDNQGTLEMNMNLSMRRANAVVQALASKYGVPAARLKSLGDGPSAPVASNDTEEGRAKNRRVELVKQ